MKNYFVEIEVSHDESQEIEKANFSALTLMLAQECNMRCSYCYGEGGEYNNKGIMTENVAFQAIDYLVKIVLMSYYILHS